MDKETPPRILPNPAGRDFSGKSSAKKAVEHAPQDLQFVHLPNDLKLDVAARKRVRSHVARDFRRRPKSPVSSSVDVDHIVAKSLARDVAPGQKHRFRFGQQGLEETKKPSKRKSASRKVSAIPQDTSSLSSTRLVPVPNISEDLRGYDTTNLPSLDEPSASTEGFIPNATLEIPYSSEFMWDDYSLATNQSHESNNHYFASPQESEGEAPGSGQLVRRADLGCGHVQSRKMDLATTGTGNLDPFNTLPIIDSSCRTQTLIHHYHLRIMASPLMMHPRKEWFSIAIQDHALFHVALSHAAGNLSLLTQNGDSVESLMHRMEAIKIINERLNDASRGISDGTIGAVASIASYEATNGTLEGVRTHMNGLEQMVLARGGLLQGGFSAHLRRLIAWADLNAANALSRAPRFPPLSDRKELRIDQFAIDPIAFQLYTTPADDTSQIAPPGPMHTNSTATTSSSSTAAAVTFPTDLRALPPKVAYCFLTLRQLSRLLAINGPKAVIRMDHTWYSDMAYTVQRRLMSLSAASYSPTTSTTPSSSSTSSSKTSSPPLPSPLKSSLENTDSPPRQQQPQITTTASLSKPCCLAALIYLECCIREVHPRSRLVATLVRDLKRALLTLHGRAGASASRLIFWALAVGAAASGASGGPGGRGATPVLGDCAAAIGVGKVAAAAGEDAEAEKGEDLHAWFLEQLGSLAAVLGVRGWQEARALLGGVLWPGRDSELTRALVWSEVEMADSRGDCWTVGSE